MKSLVHNSQLRRIWLLFAVFFSFSNIYAYDYPYDFEVDGLYYNILSSNQVEITQNDNYREYTGNLIIPERVSYNGKLYDVISIGKCAFIFCIGFSGSLIIPNSVTTIETSAFEYCTGFTGSLTIPNTLTSIGDRAFCDCTGFTGSLIIPSSVTSIGVNAFTHCGLTDLKIPNSVTSIGDLAFAGCSSLEHVKSYIEDPFQVNLAFKGISESAILEVPNGTKSKYQVLSSWSYYFKEIVEMAAISTISIDNYNYSVMSEEERAISLSNGNYGKVLEVPAKINYQNSEWTVTGIDKGVLANNIELAAVIWHPETAFTEQVSNPNLLLYVNKVQYAPSSIKNVIVNGIASNITLVDAERSNNFYCPQAFTAQKISYTHNYGMTTGIGEAKEWETIALPFDVQKVTHESKGEIISFANWRSGDEKKPFWLMQLTGSGWKMAESIKANTPYIISMPYNTDYKLGYLLNGNVTFTAENVIINKTENLNTANYSNRSFIPTYSNIGIGNGVYALNVVNDIERKTDGATEGSTFVLDLRPVHPFEAYMTSTSSTRSIGIDEGMATGIIELISALSDEGVLRIYNLNGQLVKIEEGRSLDEVMKSLPAGVYVVNGKKVIIK